MLEKQYQQIDVEIAYQHFLLRQKEADIKNASAILDVSFHEAVHVIPRILTSPADPEGILEGIR